MRKSDFDFSQPNRQSYVAILMILFKTINIVGRQLLPVILVIFIGSSKKKVDYLIYMVIATAGLSMIYALVNFFRTYFMVVNDELVIHTGVFSRKKTSIPFERIQTINFEQNIIHQFFSVLKLKVDTAGSDKNEFEFHALDSEKAYALRDMVLEGKRKNAKIPTSPSEQEKEMLPIFKLIMGISVAKLLKVGITENHLRSGGLIFVFFIWIYQSLQEVGLDVDDYSENVPSLEFSLDVILALAMLFLIVSIAISMIRSVVKHYDLQFLRSDHGFKVVSGLFTRREVSAIDHKIQFISWSDNLLKRLVGYKDLALHQASSSALKIKQNITIPGCEQLHIDQVVTTLFGDNDLDQMQQRPVDVRYFKRFALIVSVLLLIIITMGIWYEEYVKSLAVILFGLLLIIRRYLSYRKKAYRFDDQLLHIRGGIFGEKEEVMPMFKIQAVELHQSPYQTRHHLCSLSIYTASGGVGIPYISLKEGQQLCDLILYKVQASNKKWM
ncbi:MAG: PH domain-containing protein [Saprospiraceae bacterium]